MAVAKPVFGLRGLPRRTTKSTFISGSCLHLTSDPAWGLLIHSFCRRKFQNVLTLWNDITSFSWTQHLMCETGMQADAQGFGVGKSCRNLDTEIGVTLCVLRPAWAM